MLILTVIQGPDQGRRFELPDNEPQQIGRSGEALPLTDRSISRRHAELTPDDGRWYISDISSSNGFDIGSTSNKAYLLATVAGVTKLYLVNTTNGSTTAVSTFPNATRGFSVGLGF